MIMSVQELFTKAIGSAFQNAKVFKEDLKSWGTNLKTQVPVEPRDNARRETRTITIKQAFLSRIPGTRSTLCLLTTSNKGLVLAGTRLSPHGGHVAIEISRKIAQEYKVKLVVFGTTIVAFNVIQIAPGKSISLENDAPIPWNDGEGKLKELFEKFVRLSSLFNAKIQRLVE